MRNETKTLMDSTMRALISIPSHPLVDTNIDTLRNCITRLLNLKTSTQADIDAIFGDNTLSFNGRNSKKEAILARADESFRQIMITWRKSHREGVEALMRRLQPNSPYADPVAEEIALERAQSNFERLYNQHQNNPSFVAKLHIILDSALAKEDKALAYLIVSQGEMLKDLYAGIDNPEKINQLELLAKYLPPIRKDGISTLRVLHGLETADQELEAFWYYTKMDIARVINQPSLS